MIEQRYVGTHSEQRSEDAIQALADAGIGRSFHNRSLEELGETGAALKKFIIDHALRIRDEGLGFDFRGATPKATEIVMLTARAMLFVGLTTRVVPLVRLPKLLAENEAELRAIRHLVIRDFETGHENPLRSYEIALVEAFIEDRVTDNRAVTVTRRAAEPVGWWDGLIEQTLEQHNRVVRITEGAAK